MRTCPSRQHGVPVSKITNPLEISLGPDPLVALQMGNVVSGFVVFGIAVLLHAGVTWAKAAKKGIPFWTAAESLAFPGYSCGIFVAFVQPMMTSALFVIVYSKYIALKFVAALLIIGILVPIVCLMYLLLNNFPAYFVKLPKILVQERTFTSYLLRLHNYLVGKQGEWRDKTNFNGFCKRFRKFFSNFIEPYHSFIGVEIVYSLVLSILDFQLVHDIEHCRIVNGIIVLASLCYISVVIWVRPFSKPIAFHLFLLINGIQVVVAGLAFASAMSDGSSANHSLDYALEIFGLLASIAGGLQSSVDVYSKIDWVRKWINKRLEGFDRAQSLASTLSKLPAWAVRRFSKAPTARDLAGHEHSLLVELDTLTPKIKQELENMAWNYSTEHDVDPHPVEMMPTLTYSPIQVPRAQETVANDDPSDRLARLERMPKINFSFLTPSTDQETEMSNVDDNDRLLPLENIPTLSYSPPHVDDAMPRPKSPHLGPLPSQPTVRPPSPAFRSEEDVPLDNTYRELMDYLDTVGQDLQPVLLPELPALHPHLPPRPQNAKEIGQERKVNEVQPSIVSPSKRQEGFKIDFDIL